MRINVWTKDPITAMNIGEYVGNLVMGFVDSVLIDVDDYYKVTIIIAETEHTITHPQLVEELVRNNIENVELVRVVK